MKKTQYASSTIMLFPVTLKTFKPSVVNNTVEFWTDLLLFYKCQRKIYNKIKVLSNINQMIFLQIIYPEVILNNPYAILASF